MLWPLLVLFFFVAFLSLREGFVPSEATVAYTDTAGIVGRGVQEVVVPSDWYTANILPTEYDGYYWPRGAIEPDYIYPGSDPKRPLRPQTLYAAQRLS